MSKTNKSDANVRQIRRERATNAGRTRNKSATKLQQICYKSVPLLQKFRGYLRKEVANLPQTWLPIETNLIFRYEFATLSPQTRYIFVAILLYCGSRGVDEIPMDTRFLANVLAADERMLKKSLEELEFCGLLVERKKEKEEKEKTDRQTDRQTENAFGGVCVDSQNLFKTEEQSENGLLKIVVPAGSPNGNPKHSQFSIEECLKYVEVCQSNGDEIKNAKALANHLHKSGEADAFIMATLYPQKQEEIDSRIFGNPTIFSDEPCSVCFGAKLANPDGRGYSACEHCRNERGKSTGLEPKGETNNEI